MLKFISKLQWLFWIGFIGVFLDTPYFTLFWITVLNSILLVRIVWICKCIFARTQRHIKFNISRSKFMDARWDTYCTYKTWLPSPR